MASYKQYLPGDIIQDFEEPLIKHLKEKYKGQHCNLCFQRNPILTKCGKCGTVFYCSSDCQILDWENSHSIECDLFSYPGVLSSLKGDAVFQVIKLLAYLKKNGVTAKKSYAVYNGTTRCIDDLQDHYSDISNSQTIRDNGRTLAMILSYTNLFTLAESSHENVMHLYGIWRINSFAVNVNNEGNSKSIGTALYVSASIFNHSCRPNALRVIDASLRLQVRCIDAIPFGEAPTVSYLTGVRPRNVRQQILYDSFYFTCNCKLCEMEKDEPVLDYDDLQRRQTELVEKTISTANDFQRAIDFKCDLQKMFCKYDERISNFLHFTLEKLIFTLKGYSSGDIVSASKLNEFSKQVEENLGITYGTDLPTKFIYLLQTSNRGVK